jgi:hypothetical protein
VGTISPAMKESKKALQDMTADLLSIYEDLNTKLTVLAKTDVMSRYDIGRGVRKALKDPGKYGTSAAKQLAAALQVGESTLYHFKQLADVWTNKADLVELMKRRDGVGHGLSFGHLLVITTLSKESERKKILMRWSKECLGVKDMTAIAQQILGRTSAPRAGIRPKTPTAGLVSASKVLGNLQTAHENLSESVFENLDVEPGKFADKKLVERLEGLESQMSAAVLDIASDRRKIAVALDSCYRVMKQQEADDKSPSTPSKKPKAKAATTPAKQPKTVKGKSKPKEKVRSAAAAAAVAKAKKKAKGKRTTLKA